MGPVTLFDKSFLQSLSADESVWFDHFFIPNICPLFYVETLADLEKPPREGRTVEDEVRVIADKFPEMSGAPSYHHRVMAYNNLIGAPVPMTGQILVPGGKSVTVDGKSSSVFEQSDEALAFQRWQRGEYLDIERRFAKAWREQITKADLNEMAARLEKLNVQVGLCRNLQEAREEAGRFVDGDHYGVEKLQILAVALGLPLVAISNVVQRFVAQGRPALSHFASYAAFLLRVEIFFYIALSRGFLSTDRPSNRVDIAYLFYLPFCQVFVSSDRLHRDCTPLFLRADQEFVWGADLKRAIGEINAHFSSLPEATKNTGVMSFARVPPADHGVLVAQLWDRHLGKGYREKFTKSGPQVIPQRAELIEMMRKIAEAPPDGMSPRDPTGDAKADSLMIKRMVRKRKGSWFQINKDIPVI